MKLYTNENHEIIGYSPNYIPSEYAHEYEVGDELFSGKSFSVVCGYKYAPQYELDFNEDGSLKYDEHGELVYKLDEEGEKIFQGYALYPFIDSQVLARLQQEADERKKEIDDINAKAAVVRTAAMFTAVAFTDEQALQVPDLYDEWSGDSVQYKTGTRVRYNSVLYKVLTDHTSQPSWTPTEAPSLFVKVLIEDPSVIPEWEQPGPENAYQLGDKVTHNGKTWESIYDGDNVWEPGAVGTESLWKEVVE